MILSTNMWTQKVNDRLLKHKKLVTKPKDQQTGLRKGQERVKKFFKYIPIL